MDSPASPPDSPNTDLAALAGTTRAVYERNAARFDRERSKRLHERGWLDRFADGLPDGGRILDLGCGAGEPIAAYLASRGFRVTGVDIADAMLEIARTRWPDGDWRHADMRSLDLGERFDGIIGWNSFFHLTQTEQRRTLPRLAQHLLPGGALMLTVGPQAGEVIGHVGDEAVYHASLAPSEYEAVLTDLGLRVTHFVKEDATCDRQTVLLAKSMRP